MEPKKKLPIKFFQKRVSDERKTEGGGDRSEPRWVLNDEEVFKRAVDFAQVLTETIELFRNRAQLFDFIPSVLTLNIEDEAIAKSHRNEIKKVFDVNRKSNIIGFTSTNNLIVKVDSIKDALDIKANIENFPKNRIALSAINEIKNFHPNILIPDDEVESLTSSFKVGLINYNDFSLNNAIIATFEEYCKADSIQLQKVSYSPNLILFKIRKISRTQLEKIKSFVALESLSLMPKYEITLDGTPIEETVPIRNPIDAINYPTVGVLDSGISKIDHFIPWLAAESYSAYPEEYLDKGHGTFVSGVLLYGDDLENNEYTGMQGCKLFDATVYPKDCIDEDELIDNIRDAIRRNSHIKIWNMSLGTGASADDDSFSDFGMALDNIQEAFNVLICKSVGNCYNFKDNRPISRIAKSADSVRSLVVGSIAHKKSEYDFAEINHRSPFSRIGYAPAGIIKPELVSYGGNAGVNRNGDIVSTGVKSFGVHGQIISAVGTSFSTPRVTSLLAALDFNISDEFNPVLLKALAIHSSKYPDGITLPSKEKLRTLGFGLPAPVDEIIYNDPHEITLIQQDTLVKGEFFEILEFPFPENLIDLDGYFYGEIKITLVGSPVLNEKQGIEYCQSNIDVFFGTYDKLKERDISKPNILNEIGLDGNENLIKGIHYAKQFINDTTSSFATERMLLNYGKKYQPIKKWVVNLEEMTSTNREKYLKTPKKWYLKVTGLYRDFSESMALADGEELSQDFCLVITIKDNKREKMVYDNVSQLLTARSFVHTDIKLREKIRAKV